MSTTQTTRRPASSRATRPASTIANTVRPRAGTSRSKPPVISADDLANQVAGLAISGTKGKHQATSNEDTRLATMRAVNTASQNLSAAVQSGWKPGSGKQSTAVRGAAGAAAKSLKELRSMCSGDVDVERAASSIIGKLIALDLRNEAIAALTEMHAPLARLYGPTIPGSEDLDNLLSLPLPSTALAETLQTLITTYFLHVLTVLSPSSTLPHLLTGATGILEWLPHLPSLPVKHKDSTLTRIYTLLTKTTITPTPSPSAAYALRSYGLRCLAYTSPSTLSPNTFWDQAVKFSVAFVKAGEREEVTNDVMRTFALLVKVVEEREDRESWLIGRGFVGFCEYWMGFTKRTGDLHTIDRISILMQGPSSVASPSSSTARDIPLEQKGHDADALAIEGARMCAVLTRTTASIENGVIADELTKRVRESCVLLPRCRVLLSLPTYESEDQDSQRIRSKVERALERLRRAGVKMLESTTKGIAIKELECLRSFLAGVAQLYGGFEKKTADNLTPALETFFVLARTSLVPTDYDSFITSYEYLCHADALLGPDQSPDLANYVRCTSGAFHNIAGTLYQDGKYAGAVKFLKKGCSVGRTALRMRAKQTGEAKDTDVEAAWRLLREGLFRRYELLGICYSKMGDRRPAYDAFVESVQTYPFQDSTSIFLFDDSTTTKQLGTIIDRLTYIGACELLLPPAEISLRAHLFSHSSSVVGAILERQVESLETSLWKEGVGAVVFGLLQDLMSVYLAHEMPMRRARVLLRQLEVCYKAGLDGHRHADDIGDEIMELLGRETLAEDSAVAHLCPQYKVSAHLWLALHAHKRSDPAQTSLIRHHCEEAHRILKYLLEPVELSPKPKRKTAKTTPVKKTAVGRLRGKVKATSIKKLEPVTPKPRKELTLAKALEPVTLNVQSTPPRPQVDGKKPALIFEEFEKALTLLQNTSHLLGLLGLIVIKVKLLDVTRRLCERYSGTSHDGYQVASIELAHEYVKLGKIGKSSTVFGQALIAVRNGQPSDEIRATFLLRYSESLAIANNVHRSSRASPQDDVIASLEGLFQSLRLWNRGVEALARLSPQTTTTKLSAAEPDDPFAMSTLKDALPSPDDLSSKQPELSTTKKTYARRPVMDGLEWRMMDGLLHTLFALSHAFFARGSPRESEYFAQQAQDLAESINAPAMVSRALAKKGEIQLHQGLLDDGYRSLMGAAELLEGMPGADAANIRRLRGYYSQLKAMHGDARELYESAMLMLEELETLFASLDGLPIGYAISHGLTRESTNENVRPRKSTGLSPKTASANETVVPALLAAVLRQHIWLLRDDAGDSYRRLLKRFVDLPASLETKSEENALMAKLSLHDVYGRFRADMFLSSLIESSTSLQFEAGISHDSPDIKAIAMPMGMSGEKLSSLSPSTQDLLTTLNDTEGLFWADLALVARRGNVSRVRDATVSLAMIRALQNSLGKAGKAGPVLTAALLDASTAVTLRRELLEAIQQKFPDAAAFDDLQWPLITANGSPLPRPQNRARGRIASMDSFNSDDSDDDSQTDSTLKQYWAGVQERYNSRGINLADMSASRADLLPKNWTVISVTITEDQSTMFITRQHASQQPLVFCLPLKGRRESQEDEHLTFEDALAELKAIIAASDQGTRDAVNVRKGDPQARAAWWGDRSALDKRMQELLANIEFCWLGAFKTILSPPVDIPVDVITDLRTRLDKVFKRSLQSQNHRQKASKKIRLDDNLLACFSTLSPKCRDEELEDLVYFILDLYQFHGVPVAIAEVDVDQVVVDLRTALEEHTVKARDRVVAEADAHTFLVLDKNVQGIPWESIPILRGQSVSRIPSLEFLLDRVDFARLQKGAAAGEVVDRAHVDPRKAYYVLNPSGDLTGTEGRFSGWLKEMDGLGWEGTIGRAPSEQQFLNALRRKDLVVYFGHGGGEQYVRAHKIKNLPRCAATMLWGCSSGNLRDMGDFDRVGTPYNYMLAGCPTLVANLWDVTDRDIDKFSQAVFDKINLSAEGVRQGRGQDGAEFSLVAAVAQARASCKLKYLTGAAPVVYGIPFYLASSPPFVVESRRQNHLSSSAGSFQTARADTLGTGSQSGSRSSSVHTPGSSPMNQETNSVVNPIHTVSLRKEGGGRAEEVHIIKVTGDQVHLQSGPVNDNFFHKVGSSLARVVPSSTPHTLTVEPHFGTLPPSPPASIEEEREFRFPSTPRTMAKSEQSGAPSDISRSRPFVPEKLHRASTDTKISTSTVTNRGRTPRLSHQSDRSDDSGVAHSLTDTPNTTEASSSIPGPSSKPADNDFAQSPDGHLQPPQLLRPTRRNTTGSSPRPSHTSMHNQHGYGSQPFAYEDGDVEGVLASDIQQQADQIRRERNSKRVKAQQEAEAVLTRAQSLSRGARAVEEGAQVLVGNLIGEGHVNYVLMYNMLTGIRIAVSRCQAKMSRPLTGEDFSAKHKFSFDITGNELTPSAKYDFKFKDYAPWVFRELREEYFHLDPADYLLSLTAKYILSELGSPGKSGSFFYFSRDYRFIIKTIRHSEAKFLLSVLPDYHAHVKSNPHTLLSRFYGLHRVKLPHGRKIHFVIMNNLFPPHRDIHETYDLKGSTVGREYPEEKAAQNPRAVLKDLNWINRGRVLDFGPEKRALLTEQLRRDSELLKKINVMDYSLLVGIHNMERGNRDNVRSNTLKVFSPDVPRIRRKVTAVKGSTSPEAQAMRRAMRESDPKRLGPESVRLPDEDARDRQSLIFYQDEGGLRATDEANEMLDTIYYLGVIDILTPYTAVKKLEHFWKGLSADRHKISPVKPAEYGERFFSFMKAIMRGGGGGESFKPES
ncbi:hypothetical protein HWV62_12932 [Athelia sp. TMB]|nr:hypothetical protein HWV62_12932 [Athelia sp. TMB]